MKVSVALHTEQPDIDGNQRDFEAKYGGYNRQYATMDIDADGNGVAKIVDLLFASVQTDPEVFTHFSLGVCEGVDPGKGGAIIVAGPLPGPMPCELNASPVIEDQLCGVYADRLATMQADGRMGLVAMPVKSDSDAPAEKDGSEEAEENADSQPG